MKHPKFILAVLPLITPFLFSNKTAEKTPQAPLIIKTDTSGQQLHTLLIKADTQNKCVPGFAIISAG